MSALAEALIPRKTWSFDDLSSPELDGASYEIWGGELVEMTKPSKLHNFVAVKLLTQLIAFCERNPGLFWSGDNGGFIASRHPDTVLSPDAALFRIRPDEAKTAYHEYAPDLAIEVLSPSNTRNEMIAKRMLYFRFGTEQVWEVDPSRRTLEIHFSDGRSFTASAGRIRGEGIASGLEFELSAIFEGSPFATP